MAADYTPAHLQLRGISLERSGKRVLQNISLDFATQGISIVLGPNGAGKTLLLKICHGLIQATDGSVAKHFESKKRIPLEAMVFQRPVLLRRSVKANIRFALKIARIDHEQRDRRLIEALDLAGLHAVENRSAHVLSGGEQQRLALARAWVISPRVLYLDEPTSQLDPAAIRIIEDMIGRISAAGTGIIMTTHDLGQARRLADEIFFLHRGRLCETASAEKFFNHPDTDEARAFIDGRLFW